MKRRPIFRTFKSLLELQDYRDYHIHTTWTDGRSTVEECVEAALRKELKGVAFTEHVRSTSSWFDAFVEQVTSLAKRKTGLEILCGIEAKALDYDGRLDATEDMINRSDIVLGSVHRYPSRGGGYLRFQDLSASEAAETELRLACGLLKNPVVDVLAHPGGTFGKNFAYTFPEEYLQRVMEVANEHGKAVEINSSYLKDRALFFRLCGELNPLVSLGSDAHDAAEVGTVLGLIGRYSD
jgi:putative hydrolase